MKKALEIWIDKEPHWTVEQIKRVNKCPNFELSDDVITGRNYRPRRSKEDRAQMHLRDFLQ